MQRPNFAILFLMIGATLALGAWALAYYLGAFKGVAVTEVSSPGFTLLSKSHVGPYHKILTVINEAESWAKDNGIPCPKTFGEFIDDPEKTEEGRLRSNAGCWVGEGQVAIKGQLPTGFEARFVPPGPMVQAEFSGSPAIGPFKVYPKAQGYMADKKLEPAGPNFEIYTIISEREVSTRYLFPVKGLK